MNKEQIITEVAARLNVDAVSVTLETKFKEDLKADSIDLVELVMDLEDEYGIRISDEDASKIKTVGDFINVVVS